MTLQTSHDGSPVTAVSTASRVAGVKKFLNNGVGSIAAGVLDMAVLIALVETGTPVGVAAFIAAVCGGILHFTWGKYLTFRDRTPLALVQMLRFASVALVTALLLAVTIHLSAVEIHVPYVLAKLLCSVVVFAAWTYPAQRYFVFKSA